MNGSLSRRRFMQASLSLLGLTPALLRNTEAASRGQVALALELEAEYPLPGRGTRWDYLSVDPGRAKLFLAHMGDNAVVVVDTGTGKIQGVIEGIERVRGVEAIPALGRVYATASTANEVVAIDADTHTVIARAKTGLHPDGLAHAPEAGKLYVSDEDGGTCSVIDVRSNRRIAAIAMGGSVGNTRYDAGSGHIFVNVRGTGELLEIDPASDTVLKRLPVPTGKGNHGLLIEPELRLAFIANEDKDSVSVMDLRSGKAIAHFKASGTPDVFAYDQKLGLVYLATESGPVHFFQVGPSGVQKVGQQRVGNNAHVAAVNPVTHRIYFPLRTKDGKRSLLRVMRPTTPR